MGSMKGKQTKIDAAFGRVRFWFFETFGERDIERTPPAHGDWKETCGWNFRGRFYPCDKTPND